MYMYRHDVMSMTIVINDIIPLLYNEDNNEYVYMYTLYVCVCGLWNNDW